MGPSARFEPVALHEAISWRYRGQIVPTNKQITAEVEITRLERNDDGGVTAVAEANLWCDGIRIYSASNLAMRMTPGAPESQRQAEIDSAVVPSTPPAPVPPTPPAPEPAPVTTMETTLDPARDTWVADHCPSYLIPSLPMMSVLDLFVQAASRAVGAGKVVEVADLRLDRWVVVDSPKRLRVVVEPIEPGRFAGRLEVWRDAPRAELSRWETHAQAVITTANNYAGEPTTPAPLNDVVPFANPYDGTVFHGPAFATLMDGAQIGRNGSSGTLAVGRCGVPAGAAAAGAPRRCAAHRSPHRDERMDHGQPGCRVLYGSHRLDCRDFRSRVVWARFYADAPLEGTVDVEARFVGFDDDGDDRLPIVDLWLSVAGKPWAQFRLAEILLEKGPLAEASGHSDALLWANGGRVPEAVVERSAGPRGGRARFRARRDPGVVQGHLGERCTTPQAKESRQIVDIATKEAVADAAHSAIHPSQVHIVDGQVSCPALPLERISVEVEQTTQGAYRASASLQTDWQPVRRWSNDRLGIQQGGFGDLLHWALLSRYVRHVIVTDPAAMAAIRGRPVLLLGNHQVQIESLLGTTIASWLTGTQVVTIAHAKHETRWIGALLRLDAAAGLELDSIRYFDQKNPKQFLRLVEEIKGDVAAHGVSTMVHADGTRHVRSGQRVERLTSTLLDMAIDMSLPIVPLYFAGGLPEEPVDEKLEVPYRHAAQDYIFGPPIMPEDLAAWPYADRRRRVMDAINDLAPFSDAPHEPNYAVEDRIVAAAPGASHLESIWESIEDALDGLPVNWRETINGDAWTATRSPRRHTATG